MTSCCVLFLVLALVHHTQGTCYTTGGPDAGYPCDFPFKYRGVSYTECTVVDADDGKPWCSTLTDIEGKHVGGQGNWGHCPYQGCQPAQYYNVDEDGSIPCNQDRDCPEDIFSKKGYWSYSCDDEYDNICWEEYNSRDPPWVICGSGKQVLECEQCGITAEECNSQRFIDETNFCAIAGDICLIISATGAGGAPVQWASGISGITTLTSRNPNSSGDCNKRFYCRSRSGECCLLVNSGYSKLTVCPPSC